MNEHKGSEFHAVSELNSYISKLYDGPYLKLYDAQLAFEYGEKARSVVYSFPRLRVVVSNY